MPNQQTPRRGKERLDKLLVDRNIVESRARAKTHIMAGNVTVDGQVVDKPGTLIPQTATLLLKAEPRRFVSRGGDKLQAAIETFCYDCKDKVVIDVGASTGGFTDCVLQNGARRVYAIDVGYGQIAWKLREDPRVIVHERTNIRDLPRDAIPEPVDLAVIDCSFISLVKVVPNTLTFLAPKRDLLVLIKPQFEAGRKGIGKGGVVRDEEVRQETIAKTLHDLEALHLEVRHTMDCPVHGPAGNVEFLAWLVTK